MLDTSNLIQILSVLLSRRSMPRPTKGSELTVIGLAKKNVEMMDRLHSLGNIRICNIEFQYDTAIACD